MVAMETESVILKILPKAKIKGKQRKMFLHLCSKISHHIIKT